MSFREYFITAIFIFLLIWGPLDHSWRGWLVIRIGYLTLIPLAIWLLLRLIWIRWQPSLAAEKIMEQILSGCISGFLLVLAVFEAVPNMHIGNTKWVPTRDGMEAVGEDIIRPGPDWGNVVVLVVIGLCFLWFGVVKRSLKTRDRMTI